MKRTRNIRILSAVCLLLLLLLAGCGKTEETPAAVSTAAYSGSKLDLGSLEVLPTFLPRYDEGSGELTVCVRQADADKVVGTAVLRRSDENGGWDTADGSFREIAPEDGGEPLQGVLLPDGWVALSRDPAGQITLEVDRGGKRIRASLKDLLRGSDPRQIAVSDDGAVWLAAGDRIAVAEPDLTLRTSFPVNEMPLSLASDGESGAWVLFSRELLRYDANGLVIDSIQPPDGAFRLWYSEGTLYSEAAKGLFAREDNWTMKVDYAAADIIPQNFHLLLVREDGETLFAFYDEGRMSLWNYKTTDTAPQKAELTLLYMLEPRAEVKKVISNFNRTHPDIHVNITVVPDAYGGDYTRAKDALLLGLITGTYQADMVCDLYNLVGTITAHHLFEDLTPYLLRGEGKLRMDNLFGSAIRTMTYDGAIWGIPMDIQCETLVGLNSLLGEYAGRTRWTLTEEMDFIDSLAGNENVAAMIGLRQDLATLRLMYYTDLRAFIDTESGTCSFTDPEAIRFLSYMASLPVTNEELSRSSAAERRSWEEGEVVYRDGQVALLGLDMTSPFDYFYGCSMYQTDEITVIGYPTKNPEDPYSGIVTRPSDPFVILKCSAHKEECWTFIQYLAEHYGETTAGFGDYRASNILKSEYDAYAGSHEGYVFSYYADGSVAWGPEDDKPGKRGYRKTFTREDAAMFCGILDGAGSPWAMGFDTSLEGIVKEELSAMAAGHATPEVCAANLQSRVSIWLAEHR